MTDTEDTIIAGLAALIAGVAALHHDGEFKDRMLKVAETTVAFLAEKRRDSDNLT